jgi:hypothetical protein
VTGASWGVSAAGVIVAALCIIGLRHHRHLPDVTHAISVRFAIFFSFVSADAVAQTALGSWVHSALGWALGVAGGPGSVGSHAAITVAGMALAASVIVGLVFLPQAAVVYLALGTPFVLEVAGGHLHGLLDIVPAPQLVEAIAKWIGG